MKDAQQRSIGFTRREAMQIGLGTIFNTAVAAAGAPAAEAAERERLAISFWIWALWDTGTHGFFNDLELRITELVERLQLHSHRRGGRNHARRRGQAAWGADVLSRGPRPRPFHPADGAHDRWPRRSDAATDRTLHRRETPQGQSDPLELVLPAHVLVYRQKCDVRVIGPASGTTLHPLCPRAGPDPRRAETAWPGRHHHRRRDLQRGERNGFFRRLRIAEETR